ncbi:MAG: IS1595 family transposase [Acidobacteriota bacterium]|nr:IS1595 family transposase [Acidobacteriota bacterium]
MEKEPKTLQEAVIYFSDPVNCRNYLVARRWPEGVVCPHCGSKQVVLSQKFNRWQCGSHHDRRQFTLKTGTIFEDSPISLDKWLLVMWQVVNCRNGVSSYEISRAINVTQKSTWFMLHRLREVMQNPQTGGMLSGHVEVDESFIGGKARNMHSDKRAEQIHGRGPEGKAIVAAVLERGGKVRATVVKNRRKKALQSLVRDNVEAGANLYSDALKSYKGLQVDFTHQAIDHAESYVNGQVHTNGMENFWSLLKRGLHGTYISVEPFHLFRYVDEQAFRFNTRKDMNDADRFSLAVSQIVGKRLTWKRMTGNDEPSRQDPE